MTANNFGQLKHRNLVLTEQRLKLVVGIDVATVLCVLQVVLFDVIPNLLGDFCAESVLS